jgi:ABC-type transporter Mla MlaB component
MMVSPKAKARWENDRFITRSDQFMTVPTDNTRLSLSGAITIRDIDAAHQQLLAACESCAEIEIDCSEVTDTDISLIQLLIAADVSAARSGKKVQLLKPYPEAIQHALNRGGFFAGAANIWTRET